MPFNTLRWAQIILLRGSDLAGYDEDRFILAIPAKISLDGPNPGTKSILLTLPIRTGLNIVSPSENEYS